MTNNLKLVFATLVVAICGCEEPPSLSIKSVSNALPEAVVATDGRGGYDWQRDGSPFVYQRKLPLEFFSKIDPKELTKNFSLKPATVKLSEADTEGLESDIVYNLNRYFNRNPSLNRKQEVPVSPTCLGIGFHFDGTGERLITAGSRVQIWDLETGKAVSSISGPKDCRSAYFMKEAKHCLAVGEKTISILEIATQKSLYDQDFSDPIVFSTYSASANLIAVVTKSSQGLQLHVLNDHAKSICKSKAGEISEPSVSINPSGKYIAVKSKTAGRWMIENQPPEFAWINSLPVENAICLAGVESDFWLGSNGSLQFSFPGPDPSSFVHMMSKVVDAKAVTLEDKYTWAVLLGKKIGPDGKWQSFLQDAHFVNSDYSIPEIIDGDVLSLDVAKEGNLVAIGTPEKIIVADRTRFSDYYFSMSSNRFAALIQKERFKELESVLRLVRKQPTIAFNESGEELYCKLLGRIGGQWGDLMRRTGSFSVYRSQNGIQFQVAPGGEESDLSKYQKWLDQGSTAALEAYAAAMFELLNQNRFSFAKEEGVRVVDQLLKQSKPSALTFELKVLFEKTNPTLSSEQMDDLLERATKLHPRSILHHIALASLAGSSEFIVDPADADNYLSAVADLYGDEFGDAIYALMTARYLNRVNQLDLPMNRARVLRGISRAAELEWIVPSDAYRLFGRMGISFRDSQEGMDLIPKHFLRTLTFCYRFTGKTYDEYFEQVRDQAFGTMK